MPMNSPNRFDLDNPDLRIPATVNPLFDQSMRDTHVALGPDGFFYLTGTTPCPDRTNIWDYNDGIRLWRSSDWVPMGLVFSIERDGAWQRQFGGFCNEGVSPTGEPYEGKAGAVWAPAIHYIRSRKVWMLAACISDHSRGAAKEVNAFDGEHAHICRPMIVPMTWNDSQLVVDHAR